MLILISILMNLISFAIGNLSSKYSFQNDIDVTIALKNSTFTIGNYFKEIEIMCIAECNKYKDCLTVVFDQQAVITSDNCFLYKKYFESNEIKISTSKKFYRRISKSYLLCLIWFLTSYRLNFYCYSF